jgi:hypothetical protein
MKFRGDLPVMAVLVIQLSAEKAAQKGQSEAGYFRSRAIRLEVSQRPPPWA